MATLEKIRSKAGILFFVIAFALLCFIVGEFLNNTSSILNSGRNNVGKVNGTVLTHDEMNTLVNQMSEVQKSFGRQDMDDAQLRANAWESFKTSALLASEAENVGVQVSKAELNAAIIGDNPHPILMRSGLFNNANGQFDRNAVRETYKIINTDPETLPVDRRAEFLERKNSIMPLVMYWENVVKQSILNDKVSSLLVAALEAPKGQADFIANLSAEEADAKVVKLDFASVKDEDVEPSDAEMKAYYEKVKDVKYKTQGYRDMQVVVFPITPSNQDIQDAKEEADTLRSRLMAANDIEKINLLYQSTTEKIDGRFNVYRSINSIRDAEFKEFAKNAKKGDVSDVIPMGNSIYKMAKVFDDPVMRADSVRLSMIVLQDADSLNVFKRADSVFAAIKGGADFDKLVGEVSMDPNAKVTKGDQGWITEGMVGLPDFDKKAFDGTKGSSFVIKNGNVAFVFKITDKTADVKKVKFVALATNIEVSSTTIDSIGDKAGDMLNNVKNCDEFKKYAEEKGYMIRPLANLKQNQATTYVLRNSRGLIKQAFEHKEGDVLDLYTEDPNNYVAAAVENAVEEGYIPMDKVKSEIRLAVLNEKKAEKLVGQLSSVKSLEEVGTVDTVTAVRFQSSYLKVGNEPALCGAIVAAEQSKISAPVKGNMGVYVFEKIASRKSSLPAVDAQSLKSKVGQSVGQSFFSSLEDKAEVLDNRSLFY